MMSSICLAKTAVSFGAAASAMRTQPANGAAVAPASNRRLVISVMVSSHSWFTVGAVWRMQAVCRDRGRRRAKRSLPILHPGMATVHGHHVVRRRDRADARGGETADRREG